MGVIGAQAAVVWLWWVLAFWQRRVMTLMAPGLGQRIPEYRSLGLVGVPNSACRRLEIVLAEEEHSGLPGFTQSCGMAE